MTDPEEISLTALFSLRLQTVLSRRGVRFMGIERRCGMSGFLLLGLMEPRKL
jgi:hypothetical protein